MRSSEKVARTTRWSRRGRVLLERGLGLGHVTETEPVLQPIRSQVVSQEEIQQDLQRFVTVFSERLTQAAAPLGEDPTSDLFVPALRKTLLALSACLDIVAGPAPEVNLLDMVVFVMLSRDAFERHEIPLVFGERGEPVAHVFRTSEEQIWSIARKVLTPDQERSVRGTIEAWQAEHPEQFRVAGVRFTEFSGLAVDPRHRADASGVLAGVRSATRTADAALLLGQRAMFLAPRIPMIVRLHARLGVREILSDNLAQLGRVEDLLQQAGTLQPMLSEIGELIGKTSSLAQDAQKTSAAAQALSESAWPLLQGAERLLASPGMEEPQANRVQLLVESSDRLVARTRDLVGDLKGMTHGDPLAAIQAATARLELIGRHLIWRAGIVGVSLIALFWVGYFLTTHAW